MRIGQAGRRTTCRRGRGLVEVRDRFTSATTREGNLAWIGIRGELIDERESGERRLTTIRPHHRGGSTPTGSAAL